jgi:hypothetical protein
LQDTFGRYLQIASELEINGSLPPGTFATHQMRSDDEPRYWGQFPRSVFVLAQDVVLNRQVLFETAIPRAKLKKLVERTHATYSFDDSPFLDVPVSSNWIALSKASQQQSQSASSSEESSILPFESDYVTVEHGNIVKVDSLQVLVLFETVRSLCSCR